MSWRPSKLTREQMAERRREGFRLLRAGKLSQAEIARELEVSRPTVSGWKGKLEAEGMKGAKARVSSGRPSKLGVEERKKLVALLKKGAKAAGYATERWTLQRIQQVIVREFKVKYHPNYISRLLDQLGWSVQKPQSQPRERDEELIQAWLARDWPRIKKSTTNRGGSGVR